jgi:hypothetical protein
VQAKGRCKCPWARAGASLTAPPVVDRLDEGKFRSSMQEPVMQIHCAAIARRMGFSNRGSELPIPSCMAICATQPAGCESDAGLAESSGSSSAMPPPFGSDPHSFATQETPPVEGSAVAGRPNLAGRGLSRTRRRVCELGPKYLSKTRRHEPPRLTLDKPFFPFSISRQPRSHVATGRVEIVASTPAPRGVSVPSGGWVVCISLQSRSCRCKC